MIMKQLLRTVAAGAVVASMSLVPGFVSSASAALMVTFDPSGAGLGGSITPFQSDQQNGRDLARAVIDNTTGAFTETGILRYDIFNDGANIANSGVGSVYSLYLAFSGAGILNGFNPAAPAGATGSFSSISYTLFGTPITATMSLAALGIDPMLDGFTPDQLIAGSLPTGGLLLATGGSGTSAVGINNLGVPTASVVLSLTQQGTSFFLSPPGVNGFSASFTNDVTNSSVGDGTVPGTTEVIIAGSFSNSFLAVPEPASLTLLGTGLLGLGAIIRRRSAKKAS